MNKVNRDAAIVVISIAALVLVSYQSGYLSIGNDDQDVSENDEETSVESSILTG